jgi:hypothetical protein
VDVPIVGEVKPIIQATPEKIQLSASSTTEAERLIMLRSGDGRSFKIFSAKLENANGEVETTKLADGKWQVMLSIQPASIKADASIIIKTSIESQDTVTLLLSSR